MNEKTQVNANAFSQTVTLTVSKEDYVFSRDRFGITIKVNGKHVLIPDRCLKSLGYFRQE